MFCSVNKFPVYKQVKKFDDWKKRPLPPIIVVRPHTPAFIRRRVPMFQEFQPKTFPNDQGQIWFIRFFFADVLQYLFEKMK
ncbi:hypothetical protein Bhyg_01758 [Pseudolycoriella hygida]|uniref:Uncharacterized protein n=1 Tax=Pseudolycoriella hygida TaxID=35572 RepID=A0A9Q0NA52_9DIPT|nr:hypothetical protein Bhyg_01758 [Pseudolycoriella hygida]